MFHLSKLILIFVVQMEKYINVQKFYLPYKRINIKCSNESTTIAAFYNVPSGIEPTTSA